MENITLTFYADYAAFQKVRSAIGATNGWYVSPGVQMYGRDTFAVMCPEANKGEVLRAVESAIPGTELVVQ